MTAYYGATHHTATVTVSSPAGPQSPAASKPSCYETCMAADGPPGTGQLFDVSARLCPPYCGGKGCEGK